MSAATRAVTTHRSLTSVASAVALSGLVAILTGCGLPATEQAANGRTIDVGYFPNLTHSVPIVGLSKGFFQREVGSSIAIKQSTFTAGPELMTALLAGRLDVAYVGPGPAIAAYARARNLRIVAGSNSAGAVLIARTRAGVDGVSSLAGKRVAVPQLSNTQDISLRQLLREADMQPADKGGDVEIVAIAPADLDLALRRSEVDAALVPEPWGTLLVRKRVAVLVLDHTQVWAGGNYPTTVLVATDEFARSRPVLLSKWLAAHRRTIAFLRQEREESVRTLGAELKRLTGKKIPRDVLLPAFGRNIPTDKIDRRVLADFIQLSRDAGFLNDPVRPEEVLR